jgi:hypothetical protein
MSHLELPVFSGPSTRMPLHQGLPPAIFGSAEQPFGSSSITRDHTREDHPMKLRIKAGMIAVCGLAAAASATPLNYGSSGAPAIAASPGVTMLASMSSPFSQTSGGTTISGSLISSVWSSPGGLTFIYQVVQNAVATSSIEAFTINGWRAGVSIVDFGQTAGAATPPHVVGTEAAATVSRPGSPETKLNVFVTSIGPGESGYWMWFQTTETAWSVSSGTVQDGLSQDGLALFSPVIPLPPGSGMATAGLACLFGTGYLRRRRLRSN